MRRVHYQVGERAQDVHQAAWVRVVVAVVARVDDHGQPQLLADGGHLRFDLTIYSKCHIGIHIIDLLALQLYYISCTNATSRMLN